MACKPGEPGKPGMQLRAPRASFHCIFVCNHKSVVEAMAEFQRSPTQVNHSAVFHLSVRSAVQFFLKSVCEPGSKRHTARLWRAKSRSRNCSPAQIPGMWQPTLERVYPPSLLFRDIIMSRSTRAFFYCYLPCYIEHLPSFPRSLPPPTHPAIPSSSKSWTESRKPQVRVSRSRPLDIPRTLLFTKPPRSSRSFQPHKPNLWSSLISSLRPGIITIRELLLPGPAGAQPGRY